MELFLKGNLLKGKVLTKGFPDRKKVSPAHFSVFDDVCLHMAANSDQSEVVFVRKCDCFLCTAIF